MSRPGSGLRFSKLEALGNDFVLLDFRAGGNDPPPEQIRSLADRRTGIGFDQLLILHRTGQPDADCRIRIYNADGSPARQCGNGMRAVALWLHQADTAQTRFRFLTDAGPIPAQIENDRTITAGMGQPDFNPAAAGLHDPVLLRQLAADLPGCSNLGTVSVGNPHLILLLDKAPTAELVEHVGRHAGLQRCFADGVNISFAALSGPDRIALRVYERGVGSTRACGSAACATAAWLLDQAMVDSPVRIDQPGGTLVINWPGQGHPLLMQGAARWIFDGRLQ